MFEIGLDISGYQCTSEIYIHSRESSVLENPSALFIFARP